MTNENEASFTGLPEPCQGQVDRTQEDAFLKSTWDQIDRLRIYRGLSWSEIARRADMSRSGLSEAKGGQNITLRTVARLSAALDVNARAFFE